MYLRFEKKEKEELIEMVENNNIRPLYYLSDQYREIYKFKHYCTYPVLLLNSSYANWRY